VVTQWVLAVSVSWGPPSDQPEQPDRPSEPPREGGGLPSYQPPTPGEQQQEQTSWGPPAGQQQPEWAGQQSQQQWQPQPGAVAGRTPGKATASLVLGIVGLLLCPLVCSVLALVFGYQSRNEIDSDPSLGGRGTATAGIVLGWVGIAFAVLIIVLYVVGAISAT
jgi:Domain of unknown function (DUF4190)